LILRPNGQQNILHDSKYSRPPIVTANGEAMRALRAYNQDPRRPKETLARVKTALKAKATSIGIAPKARDEALRCVEIIEIFERTENSLGMRALALREPPDFDALEIEGVQVSIRPDFLVDGGNRGVGAAMLRVAKAPDPGGCKREETRDQRGHHRREMARYLIAEMQLLLEAQQGKFGTPLRDLFLVADVRLEERIDPGADNAVRIRDIRAACVQIRSLWDGIEPKPTLYQRLGDR
jgi:hypothetical protein